MTEDLFSDFLLTEVLSFHIHYSTAGMSARRSCRGTWALILKFEGKTEYSTSKGTLISDCNHCVLLPRGSAYEWRCVQSGGYYVIEFNADSSVKDVQSLYVANPDEFIKRFLKLEQGSRLKKPNFKFEAMAGVYTLLVLMTRQDEKNYALSSKLRRIMPSVEYLLKFYDNDLSNDLIASKSDVSTVYFRKIFTECYGMSPIKYLHKLRVDKAKEMLRSEFGSISSVAKSLGYSSIQHFSKTFREYAGVTPKQYAMRNG